MAPVIAALLPCILAVALPANDASGGIAKLPEINAVLGKASGKAQEFAAQATEMQARLAFEQQKHKEAMAKQKLRFETKLRVQAEMNQNISNVNARIQSNINYFETKTAKVETAAALIQTQNADMRKIMTSVSGSVGMALSFLSDSLEQTDDTDAEDLKVLAPTTPKPTLEHFMRVAGDSSLGSSLLQVKTGLVARAEARATAKMKALRSHRDPMAEDLVKVLSDSLVDILSAEQEAVGILKASFREKFRAGETNTSALLEQQRALNETQSQLFTLNEELQKARKHLLETRTKLAMSFDGLRTFANKIDLTAQEALEVDAKEFNGTLTAASGTPASATITTTTTSATTSTTTLSATTSTTTSAMATPFAKTPWARSPSKASSAANYFAIAQTSGTTTSHPATPASRKASHEQPAELLKSHLAEATRTAVESALSSVGGSSLVRAAKKAAARATSELAAISSATSAQAIPRAAHGHSAGEPSVRTMHPEKPAQSEKPAARPAGHEQTRAARRHGAAAAVKEKSAGSTKAHAAKLVAKMPGTQEAPAKKGEHATAKPVRRLQTHVGALVETGASTEPKATAQGQDGSSSSWKSWFSSWR